MSLAKKTTGGPEADQQYQSTAQEGGEVDAGMFRDEPSSDEHGEDISYFDTMLWVSDHIKSEGWKAQNSEVWDEWDEAERRIRAHCQKGELTASGLRYVDGAFEAEFSPLPCAQWSRLRINIIDGQPAEDLKAHGERYYGQARRLDAEDPDRDSLAWNAIHFAKADVLRFWPATLCAAPRRRPLTENLAKTEVQKYIRQCGGSASQKEAEKFIYAQGYRGGRDFIRAAFKQAAGTLSRGRPRNLPK